jgi:UMF1 family MFS transporter
MAQQQSVDAAGGAGGLWRRRRAVVSWCLFDWANSAYPTLIVTFVFAAYFTRAVAASPEEGTAAWGTAISLSALFVAVLSPVFGAVADQGGRRKPWLLVTSVVCIASSALLWYVTPHMAFLWIPLVLVAIGNASFEAGQVFYNAMLPEIAPRSHLGRLSGWAWGMGYAGGLACLTLALLLFVQPQHPLFGLDKATAEDVRITGPLVALWFALFAVPLFLWTPDKPSSGLSHREAVTRGLATLADTLRNLRRYRNAAHFLIARMIYTDGLNTLFAFGGIYAAGTFGMTFDEILVFGIILNVAAGLGAAAFAWIDDWIGPKRTVIIALLGLTAFGTAILLIEDKLTFYVLGCGIGSLIGPAQAASRSFMARLAPAEIRTEMFGLYALSGKATAFVGPALVGWVTLWADSQRAGMATIVAFFVVGLLLLLPVRSPPGGAAVDDAGDSGAPAGGAPVSGAPVSGENDAGR